MKTQNYIIQIPEPCHEDWNSMTPDATGKFCGSCCKSVVDFSNKTDEEIRTILLEKKNEKVCGHFRKSQVDRALNIQLDLNNLPKNMSSTKTFAIAAFIVFGTFLFSCTDLKGQKIKDIEIQNTGEAAYMKGKIRRPDPVKKTELLVRGDTILSTPKTECSENKELNIRGSREFNTAIIDTPSVDPGPILFVAGGIRFVQEPDTAANKTGTIPPAFDPMHLDSLEDQELFMGEVVQKTDTEEVEPLDVDTFPFSLVDPFREDTLFDEVTLGFIVPISEDMEDEIKPDTTQGGNKDPNDLPGTLPEFIIYPNPSDGTFNIRYDVLKRADVILNIYDEKGVLIRTLVDVKRQYEGKYTIPANLPDLVNGIYTVSLLIDGKRTTEKLVIAR